MTHNYPAADCTICGWKTETIYESDLARQVAAHSQTHNGPTRLTREEAESAAAKGN